MNNFVTVNSRYSRRNDSQIYVCYVVKYVISSEFYMVKYMINFELLSVIKNNSVIMRVDFIPNSSSNESLYNQSDHGSLKRSNMP